MSYRNVDSVQVIDCHIALVCTNVTACAPAIVFACIPLKAWKQIHGLLAGSISQLSNRPCSLVPDVPATKDFICDEKYDDVLFV